MGFQDITVKNPKGKTLASYSKTPSAGIKASTVTATTTAQNIFSSGGLLKRSVVWIQNTGANAVKIGQDSSNINWTLSTTAQPLMLILDDLKELWVKTDSGSTTIEILEN